MRIRRQQKIYRKNRTFNEINLLKETYKGKDILIFKMNKRSFYTFKKDIINLEKNLELEFITAFERSKFRVNTLFIIKKYPTDIESRFDTLDFSSFHPKIRHLLPKLKSHIISPTLSGSDEDLDELINDFIKVKIYGK